MTELVRKLEVANHSIVESIQNISAITEEVSAHSNETYESSVQNTSIVKEVGQIAQFLQKRAADLKS
jgi:methyl-accepting chemotaxis protein